MKKRFKVLAWAALVIVVLAVIATSGILFWFKAYLPGTVARQSFPQIEGELRLPGLDQAVDVLRDKMGVPHIYAANSHDLYFAQGFVHAQERFWQMDAWRHIGSGTLSEMFGKGQVGTDSFLRTLGWKQVAEQEWEQLGPEGKAILQAYADGVNAWLKDHDGSAASLEYAILSLLSPSYRIAKWTPVNSLTWGKAMAWDLRENLDQEIERAVLLKTLTPEQVAELFPDYPADYPVIVPRIGKDAAAADGPSKGASSGPQPSLLAGAELEAVAANLKSIEGIFGKGSTDIGSNSWVVSGALTATGKPILANDMHLGIQMPSIWIENSLHCAAMPDGRSLDVAGFSFPGVPGVIAGHNNRVAWAFTNLGPDVQDLFIERVNPENPNQYEVEGTWVDFTTRRESIAVAGGKPVELIVRSSRHGPIVSDSYAPLMPKDDPKAAAGARTTDFRDRSGLAIPAKYAIALSWTALTPNTPFEAIWKFDQAQNWDEFRAAARLWSVPAQNLAYADIDGNIAYQTPGAIPIRKKGDGTLPVPGWSGEYDWTGYIPFDKLPWVLNPKSGYIATANNQANPRDYAHLITKDWDYGQRAARIVDLIKGAPGKIDAAYIQRMQGDSKSLNAEVLVPILLSLKLDAPHAALRDRLLGAWDYRETIDSKATTLFETFWSKLLVDTFAAKLPAGYPPNGGSRWYEVVRNLVKRPASPWWDDPATTGKVETRDDIFAMAFAEAVAELGAKYGGDLARLPAWGELHVATFRNQTLGKSGVGLIEGLFNRGPYQTGGGKSVVDATAWTVGASFEVDWLPSEREIVDLSDLDRSLAVHTTGESGHAYSPHYADMAPLWATVQYRPMWWSRASIEKDAEGKLRLLP